MLFSKDQNQRKQEFLKHKLQVNFLYYNVFIFVCVFAVAYLDINNYFTSNIEFKWVLCCDKRMNEHSTEVLIIAYYNPNNTLYSGLYMYITCTHVNTEDKIY